MFHPETERHCPHCGEALDLQPVAAGGFIDVAERCPEHGLVAEAA